MTDVSPFAARVEALRKQVDGTDQASHTLRAMLIKAISPYLPAREGTPKRLHRNVEDGKTRGQRKRAARARANEIIAAYRTRYPEVVETWKREQTKLYEQFNPRQQALIDEMSPEMAKAWGLHQTQPRRVVADPNLAAPYDQPRYEVGEDLGGDFVVIDRGEDGNGDAIVGGPYPQRKTANRRARQLNGELT